MKLRRMSRKIVGLMLLGVLVTGCTSFIRAPESELEVTKVKPLDTVGDMTRPRGLGNAAVESYGLITGLNNTGSDPPNSLQRNALLQEMQRREVDRPHQLLAQPSTSIALVRALLPPGVKKGDEIDIEVRIPSRSKTTSLEGGWLMKTQLREVAVLNQSLRSGHVRGIAEGPILVDSLLQDGGDDVAYVRGTILSGGVATKSRLLGLTLRSEHHSVSISRLVGAAINDRFDTFIHGVKQGAAKPKTDRFIELAVHPRYRNNLIRYLRVIEQIQLRQSGPERLQHLESLESELQVPSSSSLAALKLEAIGNEAEPTLSRGLDSPSFEVRFYAAEALAYLDEDAAAPHLGQAAKHEPAFRSRALLALGAMSSVEAHDQLTELLHVPSAETRYGAFRALQNMNPRDPTLGQEILGSRLYFHEIASAGEPMIHIARTRRPEIVMFGSAQLIDTPFVVFAGRKLMVKGESGRLKMTRYTPGGDDQVRICQPLVDDLIRNLIEIGATYPEIVNTLHHCKRQGCLKSRLVFDAIPQTGRRYHRPEAESPVAAN